MNSVLAIKNAAFEAFRPPKKLSLSEWADMNAYLSAESSAESGRWHTLPYQKGIMDAVTDPNVEQVTLMKSARVGYTKILNHIIGYHIHQDPCPIMVVQPTIEDAAGYSKEEISPMLRDTKCLRGLISEAKAKDGNNTILQKNFNGGTLSLVGANSPRGFRRVSRRIVLFDETDGYPVGGAGSEGDQIKLGIRRTEYYWNRKIVAGSTPTLEDFSRIEKMFKESDQRRYYVPCPDCGHFQYLKWANMKWTDNDPSTAAYACESCGVLIPHNKKRWMVERGEWRAAVEGNGKHVGFHIWAAYSYSPNASWSNLVEEFLVAKNDREQLQTFCNTVWGEVWSDDYQAKIGADALMQKAAKEKYQKGVPPKEALVLVGGCDCQDDRLSLSIFGYGRSEECYLIDRIVIYGSPSRADVWAQLDEVLLNPYKNEDGIEMKIEGIAIDSGGHHTQEVYQYARERQHLGVIPIKGVGTKNKEIIGKPTKVEVNYAGKALRASVRLFTVGVDRAKTTLHNRLRNAEEGSGYIHFYPSITPDYFEELTAERQVVKVKDGFQERIWVKKSSARNEALDEWVYGYACLHRCYQRYDRRTIWDQFAKRLVNPANESKTPTKVRRQSVNSGYVNSW
jgi:phage terminase large subunit GpA-like protein